MGNMTINIAESHSPGNCFLEMSYPLLTVPGPLPQSFDMHGFQRSQLLRHTTNVPFGS